MRISPINNNNQISSKAVNQKYYQWAEREAKGVKRFGELLYQLKFDVSRGNLLPKDALDTIFAIEKIYPTNRKSELDQVINYINSWLA